MAVIPINFIAVRLVFEIRNPLRVTPKAPHTSYRGELAGLHEAKV